MVTALKIAQGKAAAWAPTSSAGLANQNLTVLRAIGGIKDIPSDAVGEAVLTGEQQRELLAIRDSENETGVIKYLTPYLVKLRAPGAGADTDPCPSVLVNSENKPWLEHPSSSGVVKLRQKPDLFRSWEPFVAYSDGTGKQGSGPEYRFGVLAGGALQQAGCVAELYEAKQHALTESYFGELCGYHQSVKGPCYGMLFNATDFWLYESCYGHPVGLLKGAWTAPGSAGYIRDFFSRVEEPPLLQLLRRLLTRLKVTLCPIERRSYLGSGAYGHVFAVKRATHQQALKVVVTTDGTHIVREYNSLMTAAASGAPVIPPVSGSCILEEAGGGYLLQRVGTPIKRLSHKRCLDAFQSLATLHKYGIVHGDARLPNLLLVDGTPMWIDLLQSTVLLMTAPEAAINDAGILACSILRVKSPTELPEDIRVVLSTYKPDEDGTVAAVAAAVWSAHRTMGSDEAESDAESDV